MGSLETGADITNIWIPIRWVSVDEYAVWGWYGNSGDFLDEGGKGDCWLAEAVDELQCPLVLCEEEASWSNLKLVHISVYQSWVIFCLPLHKNNTRRRIYVETQKIGNW